MHQQPYPPMPPQQPKKRDVGRMIGLAVAGLLGLTLFAGCVAALSSSGGTSSTSLTP
jgi:hypothetical protein